MVNRITSTALAVVAAAVTFWIATVVDVPLQVPTELLDMSAGSRDMTVFHVLLLTILVGFGAMVVANLLDRFVPGEAKRIWSLVAIIILGLSVFAVYPLEMEGGTVVWQIILHLVYGLILIGGFWLSWPEQPTEEPAEVAPTPPD